MYICTQKTNTTENKCIGDYTKAAARQSLNYIKNKKKIKYGEKRFSIWLMEFFHPAMWQDHDIDFVRWLHPEMWHVALESWQWIHQVSAPCNVIRGSGMTCHWIRPKSAILEFYILFPFPHITAVDMSFCTSLRNFIQISLPSAQKNDVMSIFTMRISDILDFRDPIMGSLKSPVKLT